MKCLNKILSLFLCFSLCLSTFNVAYAANIDTNPEEIQEYSVPIISNEYKTENTIYLLTISKILQDVN